MAQITEVAPTEWTKGICSCCSSPLGITGCLYATFCPWCAVCDIAEWSGDNKFLMCCCINCPCVAACLRGNVRSTLGIEGSCVGDLLCMCICPPALCQMLNEIKARTGGDDQNKFGIRKGVKYDVDAIRAKMGQQGAGAPQQGYPPQY